MHYLIINLLSIFIMMMVVLVGIAFLTLLERKILGFIQDRKGPNKVGMIGFIQPISDAIKLFTKEMFKIYKSNQFIYYLCPILSLMIMFLLWLMYPIITNVYFLNYSILLIFLLMSLGGYLLLMIGWSSNSVYSILGSIRSLAQTLSYEVSFIMIVLIFMILSESYSIMDLCYWQKNYWFMFIMFPVFLMFFISVLAELNRSPLDFIEGESELVSGFNVEYFSGGFAMIFLGEYGMIIFFSCIMILIFTNLLVNNLLMYMFINLFSGLIIFMRGMLPRMRYDELMYLCWKIILPLILSYLMLILGIKSLILLMS
nr:NADH dehydrogenase subunit 1 [Stigmatomma silvestrii]